MFRYICIILREFQSYVVSYYYNFIKNYEIKIFTWLLIYLLTPWCRVLLEKLTGLQLVKNLPAFHGTRRFITALTSVRQLSLSWASPIQSKYPHPTSWRSILILSTHLRLGLPNGLLPSGFPSKTLYTTLSSPIRATSPTHLILLDFIHGGCLLGVFRHKHTESVDLQLLKTEIRFINKDSVCS